MQQPVPLGMWFEMAGKSTSSSIHSRKDLKYLYSKSHAKAVPIAYDMDIAKQKSTWRNKCILLAFTFSNKMDLHSFTVLQSLAQTFWLLKNINSD
jgi:hypothetical protein